jgi:hypothetical protein
LQELLNNSEVHVIYAPDSCPGTKAAASAGFVALHGCADFPVIYNALEIREKANLYLSSSNSENYLNYPFQRLETNTPVNSDG